MVSALRDARKPTQIQEVPAPTRRQTRCFSQLTPLAVRRPPVRPIPRWCCAQAALSGNLSAFPVSKSSAAGEGTTSITLPVLSPSTQCDPHRKRSRPYYCNTSPRPPGRDRGWHPMKSKGRRGFLYFISFFNSTLNPFSVLPEAKKSRIIHQWNC